MKQYLLTLFCLCVSMIALAQQKTITGTVIDANNEPVIGASVLEKGTSNGTITNLDGEYSLSVLLEQLWFLAILVIKHKKYQLAIKQQ